MVMAMVMAMAQKAECMMKILVICTKYPESTDDSYLTSELADAMAAQGHAVTVVALQWEAKEHKPIDRQVFPSGVEVNYFGPKSINFLGLTVERVSRWTLSSLIARIHLSSRLRGKTFDLAIVFGPLAPISAIVVSQLKVSTLSLLYMTDFFPYAQRDLGLVPRGWVITLFPLRDNLLQAP